MDSRCTVCTHTSRGEIDRALMAGYSLRSLAAQYGVSASALSRHLKHLDRALAAGDAQEHQRHQAAHLDQLDLLQARLDRIFRRPKISTPSTSPSAVFRSPSVSSASGRDSASRPEAALNVPVPHTMRLPPDFLRIKMDGVGGVAVPGRLSLAGTEARPTELFSYQRPQDHPGKTP